jgi:hypothetical protein
MKNYVFKKVNGDTSVTSKVWDTVEQANLDELAWSDFPEAPNTYAKGVVTDSSIVILMATDEKELRSCEQKVNGLVCRDSCMEFFFCPDANDARYLNFEVNALGVMHLGLGASRHDRTHPVSDMSIFNCQSLISGGIWYLRYEIPFAFIKEHFEKLSPVTTANFYKCGDDTGHEHYATWNRVGTENPDYHRPEYFGKVIFEI